MTRRHGLRLDAGLQRFADRGVPLIRALGAQHLVVVRPSAATPPPSDSIENQSITDGGRRLIHARAAPAGLTRQDHHLGRPAL
ncbi:MAG: hypothetical protein ACHQZR_01720 [Candidatus Limnocylindrales bacterium]